MKPVFQTIVDKGRGDCHRAATASMFHLELEQVPHFRLFDDNWFNVYWHFLLSLGYEYQGAGSSGKRSMKEKLADYEPVNGCYFAIVPSQLFEDCTHAVLINQDGLVIHDPNPNNHYLGLNVIETGQLKDFHIIGKSNPKVAK